MNLPSQVMLSVSEIFAAILFVIIAKKIKLGVRKVTINSIDVTGEETIPAPNKEAMTENDIRKTLATWGMHTENTEHILKVSSASGIIYFANIFDIKNIIRDKKVPKIYVFNKNTQNIKRQMLNGTPIAGIIMANLANENIMKI